MSLSDSLFSSVTENKREEKRFIAPVKSEKAPKILNDLCNTCLNNEIKARLQSTWSGLTAESIKGKLLINYNKEKNEEIK